MPFQKWTIFDQKWTIFDDPSFNGFTGAVNHWNSLFLDSYLLCICDSIQRFLYSLLSLPKKGYSIFFNAIGCGDM